MRLRKISIRMILIFFLLLIRIIFLLQMSVFRNLLNFNGKTFGKIAQNHSEWSLMIWEVWRKEERFLLQRKQMGEKMSFPYICGKFHVPEPKLNLAKVYNWRKTAKIQMREPWTKFYLCYPIQVSCGHFEPESKSWKLQQFFSRKDFFWIEYDMHRYLGGAQDSGRKS